MVRRAGTAPAHRPRSHRIRTALAMALFPGIVGVLLAHWPPTEELERAGLDLLFQARGGRPAPEVCVVAVDDDSYEVLGVPHTASWPRGLHAELIRTLAREGARVVAFDILFDEPRDPQQDLELESAIAETGIVVLGSSVEMVDDPRFRKIRLLEPWEPFARAAAAVGEVNLPTDRDGAIRSTWLLHEGNRTLALGAYRVATGTDPEAERGARFIDYYGPARAVSTVSFYQALDPVQYLPPGFFRGKLVFVGIAQAAAGGPAAKDAYRTPFTARHGETTYGVEIHATIAANLLEGRRIDLLPPLAEAALLLLLPVPATLAFIFLRPVLGSLALVVFLALPWIVGYGAFTAGSLWLPMVIPSAVQLPLAWASALIWYYLTTVRERERIKRAFAFYLSPEMIRRISADPGSLELGGEEVEATAVFTDIRGFTSIAESMTAHQTAELLNRYFSKVTRHVFDSGGTLIKYIGDAVFAIWGAPLRMEDHATAACSTALALARAQQGATAGNDPAAGLVTRIGVHSGPMVVGNLGSAQRFDYTAIGDAVNLASRLEGLNKILGTLALASADTVARTDGRFATRVVGKVRVVGRSEPVVIHELVGLREGEAAGGSEALERFSRALEDFGARRFREAARGFREVRELRGGADGPSEFYLGVIERFEREPPPDDWDGVVTFERKG